MAENMFNRFQNDLARARKARRRAQRLVDQFLSVAERLIKWKTVGFTGTINGDPLGRPIATSVIRFDELPSLESIYRAQQAWKDANKELRGTLEAMSADERREALRRYPKLRKLLG
jgi:hypothetical protein